MSHVTELMETQRWVYWLDETATEDLRMDKPRYRVSIVVEGESGHFPAKNAGRGYTQEEEFEIMASSMFPVES